MMMYVVSYAWKHNTIAKLSFYTTILILNHDLTLGPIVRVIVNYTDRDCWAQADLLRRSSSYSFGVFNKTIMYRCVFVALSDVFYKIRERDAEDVIY